MASSPLCPAVSSSPAKPQASRRNLVFQAPAPVVARMLGYDDTTARLTKETGGTWRHHAPGNHSQ
ncbi:hypothetical protein SSP35_14_00670 [Streptomyces sp. NBRC 110611]|nr:hypothetical protein SSP35_14_00670 [Streptomyces sp. NBRC 110611]